MISDDRADRLAAVAIELVQRVRDEDPEANGRWLASVLPGGTDWFSLCFILAAAIPDDRSWSELTEWWTGPVHRRVLKPCGTKAAVDRHQARGEELDEACSRLYQSGPRRAVAS